MTPWTVVHQAPLSMRFPRQEYWSGLLYPFSRGFSRPRDQTQVSFIAGRFFIIWATREAHIHKLQQKHFKVPCCVFCPFFFWIRHWFHIRFRNEFRFCLEFIFSQPFFFFRKSSPCHSIGYIRRRSCLQLPTHSEIFPIITFITCHSAMILLSQYP